MSIQKAYLLGHLEKCTTDFYYSRDTDLTYKLFYFNPVTGNWNRTTTNVGFIDKNYVFDTETLQCYQSPTMSELGMTESSYNFLMGLTAILIGFTFLIGLVMIVSRRGNGN